MLVLYLASPLSLYWPQSQESMHSQSHYLAILLVRSIKNSALSVDSSPIIGQVAPWLGRRS